MAKKSSHGYEIGKIEMINEIRYYMSDNQILRNYGNGIKLYKKIKPELNMQDIYNKHLKGLRDYDNNHPCMVEYNNLLFKYGLNKRVFLHNMVKQLWDDPDGLCSELSEVYDSRLQFNFTNYDCIELCNAYNRMIIENKKTL